MRLWLGLCPAPDLAGGASDAPPDPLPVSRIARLLDRLRSIFQSPFKREALCEDDSVIKRTFEKFFRLSFFVIPEKHGLPTFSFDFVWVFQTILYRLSGFSTSLGT
jgi:hypothetical protein